MSDVLAGVALIDQHCHGTVRRAVDRAGFEALLTEAGRAPDRVSLFDSRIGAAVRRWCPPVLGLAAHATPEEYLSRRAELGPARVRELFLAEAGIELFCVDTGYRPEPLDWPGGAGEPGGFGGLGGPAREIVRLESVAEEVAATLAGGGRAADFGRRFTELLAERTRGAAGVKSIAAYRVGLDLPDRRPTGHEVLVAADRWLSALAAGATPRLADRTLCAFAIWTGIELGLPVQVHVGLGDRDVLLHRCDPLLLTGLLRATEPAGVPIVLLHNYPFHRHAGYLAQVFGHVYCDLSLTVHNVGSRAGTVLAELLELAPFGKVLFATDAYGLAELFWLGTVLFRRALTAALDDLVGSGDAAPADARRWAELICSGTARALYRLPPTPALHSQTIS